MSSEALVEGPNGVLAGWETEGQVRWGKVSAGGVPQHVSAPGTSRDRKHPALAVNRNGETLLVWTEGTGWQRGGALAWQVYDGAGRPAAQRGVVPGGIPVWGLATAVAGPDGGFTIIH